MLLKITTKKTTQETSFCSISKKFINRNLCLIINYLVYNIRSPKQICAFRDLLVLIILVILKKEEEEEKPRII